VSKPLLEVGDASLIVTINDDVKMRFYRAAILANYPGQTRSGMKLAAWMIECMDWKTGIVVRNTSARRFMLMTKLARARVDDGLKELVEAGLIDRVYMGNGRKGQIKVSNKVAQLAPGTSVSELWSKEKAASLRGRDVNLGSGLVSGPPSGLDMRPERPHYEASYPIPSYPEVNPGSSGAGFDVDQAPTTEGSLPTPTPQFLRPETLEKKKEPPSPPVASATTKTHVALATSNGVPVASTGYGYGTEIAGLNEYTDDVVDRVVAMQAGIITNKDPAWVAVLGVVRQTSPRRVMAAVLDLEVAHATGKLRSPVLRALRGFAVAISEEDAAAKLEEAGKPKRISAAEKFGWRR
jgi:hypothetical protein